MKLSPEELQKRRQELLEKRKQKQALRVRRYIYYLITGLIFAGVLIAAAWYTYQQGPGEQPLFSWDREDTETAGDPGRPGRQWVSVLVMGTDISEVDQGRTDTMMVFSFKPGTGDLGVLSIPRDTRVRIPGQAGWNKINAAHVFGGPELAMEVVESLLGIDIDYYVKLDFPCFERIIDTLGGVKIDVEKRMRYDDYSQGLHIDLEPGVQVLNGKKALEYVRFRSDGLGDISLVDAEKQIYDGRVARQKKFVRAVVDQVLKPSILPKVPSLASQLWAAVDTNVPVFLMLRMAMSAGKIDFDRVKTEMVPGHAEMIDGVSYWIPDRSRLCSKLSSLLGGGNRAEARLAVQSGG